MERMPVTLRLHLQSIVALIYQLPRVSLVILFGSYAKGKANTQSDVDLAVFFDKDQDFFLEEYRALVKICNNPDIDYQVQAFSVKELGDPCGIIEEILTFGKVLVPAV